MVGLVLGLGLGLGLELGLGLQPGLGLELGLGLAAPSHAGVLALPLGVLGKHTPQCCAPAHHISSVRCW